MGMICNVEIDQHNASEYISCHRSINDVMKKRIDIVFPDLDDEIVRIELDDSLSPKTFKAILDNLPAEVGTNKWGEELYTDRTTIAVEREDNAKREVNELDVAFWPEGNALCLFYGQTPIS
jgi:hypothetical protein